ncbi:MAG: PDZ domain-containing protein, partial [Actinomycetia bacterium]|nr:PDZ domain-containing protein [Actinomycetes bacterium]
MIRGLHWFIVFALLTLTSPTVIAAPAEKASKPKPSDYDLYKLLIDSIDQVQRNYIAEVDRRELIESAIRGVLSELDPYSTYIGPEELQRFRDGIESEFGGIGVQIDADAGQLKILSPIHGTPAYRADLIAGDRILEIDGKSTDGLGIDEAVELLKGEEGTSVSLVIVHPGEDAARKV